MPRCETACGEPQRFLKPEPSDTWLRGINVSVFCYATLRALDTE